MIRAGRGAFTLIELLVVIAIVGVLAALAFPATNRVVQGGKASGCISNLRQLGAAVNLYLADHNGYLPNLKDGRQSTADQVPVIDNTLNTYITDPRVFICPADNQGIGIASGTSYYWDSVISGQRVSFLQFFYTSLGSQIPLLCDKQGFHPFEANKVNMLYADGHATQDLKFSVSQ
jgi:prepilin-type N-terminal cleavage/methylation domain-containing protein/prepilin-type processing-associated H-X9-DG protein